MVLNLLLSNIPIALVLLVGLGLSVRNFYRPGRSARAALFGYLLVLLWSGSYLAMLVALHGIPPGQTTLRERALDLTWSAAYYTQHTTTVLGYALLAWAVFAGRSSTRKRVP
jgi:hypothetical protein